MREQIIQGGELYSYRIGCDRGWTVAADHDGHEMHHPPYGDGNADKRQENDGAP